jgi:hypothetical protein
MARGISGGGPRGRDLVGSGFQNSTTSHSTRARKTHEVVSNNDQNWLGEHLAVRSTVALQTGELLRRWLWVFGIVADKSGLVAKLCFRTL